jgi:hypothetical protein
MNKLILFASLLFITASCAKQEQQHTSDANVQTTAIAIPTVQCSMCTETITDALKAFNPASGTVSGSPKFPLFPFGIIPSPQTPRELLLSHQSGTSNAAFPIHELGQLL